MEFYGYKKCSTCRKAHKHLTDAGIATNFYDFVVQPPDKATLSSWVERRGEGIQPFVNVRGTRYRELGLAEKTLSDDEWLELLTAEGKLLKRPVLVDGDLVLVGYDAKEYDAVIADVDGR